MWSDHMLGSRRGSSIDLHLDSDVGCDMAMSLSEFASKADEIFKCKKHTLLAGNCWSYIFAIKVRTKMHLNMHQRTIKQAYTIIIGGLR